MSRTFRLTAALVVSVALAAGSAAGALAAPSDSAAFGQHVASCAKEHLGKRANPPAVTCTHDETTMSFENFGAMVQHIKEMHA